MLLTAVAFPTIVLAVHILAVVAAFGVVIAYPVIALTVARLDRRSVPVLHQVRVRVARALVNPGLLLVVIAGVYLAAHGHEWHRFFVQWGIGAAIVIGGLEGSLVIRQQKRLGELAARDIGAARGSEVNWGEDYLAARGRADLVSVVMALLVAATVVVMVVK